MKQNTEDQWWPKEWFNHKEENEDRWSENQVMGWIATADPALDWANEIDNAMFAARLTRRIRRAIDDL